MAQKPPKTRSFAVEDALTSAMVIAHRLQKAREERLALEKQLCPWDERQWRQLGRGPGHRFTCSCEQWSKSIRSMDMLTDQLEWLKRGQCRFGGQKGEGETDPHRFGQIHSNPVDWDALVSRMGCLSTFAWSDFLRCFSLRSTGGDPKPRPGGRPGPTRSQGRLVAKTLGAPQVVDLFFLTLFRARAMVEQSWWKPRPFLNQKQALRPSSSFNI